MGVGVPRRSGIALQTPDLLAADWENASRRLPGGRHAIYSDRDCTYTGSVSFHGSAMSIYFNLYFSFDLVVLVCIKMSGHKAQKGQTSLSLVNDELELESRLKCHTFS